MLPNPSFEEGGEAPEGYRFTGPADQARDSWTQARAHSGNRCLAFFPSMHEAAWESDCMPVVPDRPYGLTWWTQFEGSTPWHWSYHCNFVGIVVRFLDPYGREVGRLERRIHCLQTSGWQQAWIKLVPPKEAATAAVAFVYRTGIETDGRVWVDDVALEPLAHLPPVREGYGRLVVRTTDAEGSPLPARIWVRSGEGEYLFPKYSYRFTVPRVGFHAAPEDCCIDLRAGTVTAGASRGFEYEPVEQTATIGPGETRELRLALRRTVDMPSRGWLAGDHHSHLFFHKSTQHPHLRPEDVFQVAKAEGLNYLSLDGEMIEFRRNLGHEQARDRGFVGEVGLEAVTDFYGHVCLVGVREDMPGGFPMRMVVWPPNEIVQSYVADQGGAVISAHPLNGINLEDFVGAVGDPQRRCLARELAVDVLLGRRVCYDVYSDTTQRLTDVVTTYYHLLNLGRRVGITASTDYYVDQGRGACGAWRTYARSGKLDFGGIAEAYREGRTFATNGPLLILRVEGAEPGDEVEMHEAREVEVALLAISQWSLQAVELVVNGEVRRRWETSESEFDVTERVRLTETSWIAARVFGPKAPGSDCSPMSDEPGQFCGQFAHASPVYVRIGGSDFRPRRAAVEFCLEWVEAMGRAVDADRAMYLSADLSDYGVTGAEAFEFVMSRIAEAKRIAQDMLDSAAAVPG